MTRIYPEFVYGDDPRAGCYWDTTCDVPDVPSLQAPVQADVAIIGAGFTGLSAAISLADAGTAVVVLDVYNPGWGASGRNGGFCCLGGGLVDDTELDQALGREERLRWRHAEKAAVEHVAGFLAANQVDADLHSDGETVLAHRPRDVGSLETAAREIEENYGVVPTHHAQEDLVKLGMNAGFYGGLTIPIGFALNPRKYVAGLVQRALAAGVQIYKGAAVQSMSRENARWTLRCKSHSVTADSVIVATNGYSSEHIPRWLSARYMPVQSNVLVTRPISTAEQSSQGWSSNQMCYDTRRLLHYFHMLPNNRMVFGMRGGLRGTAAAENRARARLKRDFDKIFPAWRDVPVTHSWSGLVCMARRKRPFVGPVQNAPGLWCSMAYHGNGVAMGSFCGSLIGRAVATGDVAEIPLAMREPMSKFPLGKRRRVLLPPVYAGFMIKDL